MARQYGAQCFDAHVHLPAEHAGQGLRAAAEGDVLDVDVAGLFLQALHCDVQVGALAGRAVLQRAGLRFRHLHHAFQRLRHGRMHGEHGGCTAEARDVHEVLQRVVKRRRAHEVVEAEVGGRAEEQRVAVRVGALDLDRADRPARAALVVDDDRLVQDRGHARRVLSREDVCRAAGREGDDDANRLGRVGLRRRHARCADEQRAGHGGERACETAGEAVHPRSPARISSERFIVKSRFSWS